jgi:hypothetical protein
VPTAPAFSPRPALPTAGKTTSGLPQFLDDELRTAEGRAAEVCCVRFVSGGLLAVVGEDDDSEDSGFWGRSAGSFDFSLLMH